MWLHYSCLRDHGTICWYPRSCHGFHVVCTQCQNGWDLSHGCWDAYLESCLSNSRCSLDPTIYWTWCFWRYKIYVTSGTTYPFCTVKLSKWPLTYIHVQCWKHLLSCLFGPFSFCYFRAILSTTKCILM